MSNYIKKEEATSIPVIPKEHRKHFNNLDDAFETGWNEALAYVNDIQPADVVSRENYESMERTVDLLNKALQKSVEVVRCKDCKHHEELLNNNDGNVLCWVHDTDVVVDRNGYCNYGERKEQEHE